VAADAIVQLTLDRLGSVRVILRPEPIVVTRVETFNFGHTIIPGYFLIHIQALQNYGAAIGNGAAFIDNGGIDIDVNKDVDDIAMRLAAGIINRGPRPEIGNIEVIDLGYKIIDINVV
jgi:hypothetical protein